jgi:hypothetical protein
MGGLKGHITVHLKVQSKDGQFYSLEDVLSRSKSGIVGSNPTQDMNVCVHSVFVFNSIQFISSTDHYK